MAPLSPRRFCSGAIAILALACLSSCAEPLAPGYKIEKQSINVRFVPGSPPHLAVRAEYRLANTGNASLDSIEVGLPGHKSFGRENLRVQVNGRDVSSAIAHGEDADVGESSSTDEWPVVWRIPFTPAWPRKQERTLAIEYGLTATFEPRGRMYVTPSMFLLNDSGWFPDPLAPKSLFAKDLVRPDPSELDIIVPENFLALGSGEARGLKKSNAGADYHYRIRKDDFDPFIIAGQYHEQRVTTTDGTVVIWSFKPVPPAEAHQTAAQIATSTKFYSDTYEPLPRSMRAIYDVELPENNTMANMSREDPAGFFLPGVVYDWLNGPSQNSSPELDMAFGTVFGPEVLGSTWFDNMIRPRPEAWMLSEALIDYASGLQKQKNRASPSRVGSITSDLHDYDAWVADTAEKPILSLAGSDSENQLQIGRDKLELFLFALEDKCGTDNLNHSLAHLVSTLRFQKYDYDDFRSAVEQECHQDLGSFFRAWLNEKGIPADFRSKYEPASQKKN